MLRIGANHGLRRPSLRGNSPKAITLEADVLCCGFWASYLIDSRAGFSIVEVKRKRRRQLESRVLWGDFQWGVYFVLLVLALGCGRDSSAGDNPPEEALENASSSDGNPLTAPVDYLGAVNQAQKSSANKISLLGIQQAIQQFKVVEDRLPRSLEEVVSSGFISRLPEMPRGQTLQYDPQTGIVSSSAGAANQ